MALSTFCSFAVCGYAMVDDILIANCCVSQAANGCYDVLLIVTSPSNCDAKSTTLLCHPVVTLCIFRMFSTIRTSVTVDSAILSRSGHIEKQYCTATLNVRQLRALHDGNHPWHVGIVPISHWHHPIAATHHPIVAAYHPIWHLLTCIYLHIP